MCGVAGAIGFDEIPASVVIHGAIYAQQHRGQDGCGITAQDADGRLRLIKGVGLVTDVFPDINAVARQLPGRSAIGHLRYATTGGARDTANTQPFTRTIRGVQTSIVYNGNLENYAELRHELEESGAIFESDVDTEVFLHLMARSPHAEPDLQLIDACSKVKGAYTILALTPTRFVALRDPFGFRPLSMCRIDERGVLIASETNAFSAFARRSRISETRTIEPGEVVVVDTGTGELRSRRYAKTGQTRQCSFELVYFGRPDSDELFDASPYAFRIALGERMAARETVETDLVIGVPDSGINFAIGFARAMQQRMLTAALDAHAGRILTPEARTDIERPLRCWRYVQAIVRSHYIKRVFIDAEAAIRALKASIKHGPIRSVIANQRVWLGDDSIVRADTAKKIVEFMRDMGAKEVHLRSAAPRVVSNCRWGIDTPLKEDLIAYKHPDIEAINAYIGSDTLAYTALDDYKAALSDVDGRKFCFSCHDGKHPTDGIPVAWENA